jgi:hypothetical protein
MTVPYVKIDQMSDFVNGTGDKKRTLPNNKETTERLENKDTSDTV